MAVGLTPLGIAADIRDLTAAVRDVYQGSEGGATNLMIAAVGFLPLGDVVKVGRRAVGEGAEEGLEQAVLRADADPIRERYGPARESHPEEFENTLTDLRQAGVDIDLRPGSLGYSPREGEPGRFIFDPDASIGALRHERRHFEDVRDMGYPILNLSLKIQISTGG